jgi:hypothetical protein
VGWRASNNLKALSLMCCTDRNLPTTCHMRESTDDVQSSPVQSSDSLPYPNGAIGVASFLLGASPVSMAISHIHT